MRTRCERWRRAALVSAWLGVVTQAALLGTVVVAQAQQRGLPAGPMQEKARTACLACHTASIIIQQQLDRRVWTKEVDKMIRWGAPLAAEDREALIDYLTQHFGPREERAGELKLPAGEGVENVRAACLSCHDAALIAEQQLDGRGWSRELDKMARWGATVRTEDREVILRYLSTHFSAPTKNGKEEAKPK